MTIKSITTMDGSQIPIRQFNLDQLCPNPQILIIAKRGSGKTVLVSSIIKYLEKTGCKPGVIISPTDKRCPLLSTEHPSHTIKYEVNNELIGSVLSRQETMIKQKVDARTSLVLDDCINSNKTWTKDDKIMEMFFNGRHYKLSTITAVQYPLGFSPELRSNFDYIFILAEDFTSNIKRIYEQYAGMFPTLDAFRQAFKVLTQDYGAMVIVNRGPHADFLDKVFWFKAEMPKRKKSMIIEKPIEPCFQDYVPDYDELLHQDTNKPVISKLLTMNHDAMANTLKYNNMMIDSLKPLTIHKLFLQNHNSISKLLDEQMDLIRILNKE